MAGSGDVSQRGSAVVRKQGKVEVEALQSNG